MADATLALFFACLALAFGLRTLIQVQCTGSSGFVGLRGRVGSVEWLGGVLFAVAPVLGSATPALDLAGVLGLVEQALSQLS